MARVNLTIEKSESPAGNDLFSVYASLSVEDAIMPDILDINEFFRNIAKQGRYPLITCTCGIFECGGQMVEVRIEGEVLHWKINKSTYKMTKIDIKKIGNELIKCIEQIKKEHAGYKICSGTLGEDISNNVTQYKDIIQRL